jgi:hypothetical protein
MSNDTNAAPPAELAPEDLEQVAGGARDTDLTYASGSSSSSSAGGGGGAGKVQMQDFHFVMR